MGYKRETPEAYFKDDIQKAITSWKEKKFRFILATACGSV
jgi:hypothetical protein